MDCFVETGSPVVGFCVSGDRLFLLCGTELIRASAATGEVEARKTVFEKDGMARLIRSNGAYLAVSDFCTLSVFRADTLEKVRELKLGSDLSSDVCGLMMDDRAVYACIRNGGLERIGIPDLSRSSAVIGSASSWALAAWKDGIFAGTVDGNLLRLDRETLRITASLPLGKQNVRSLYVDGDTLFAAGQDKKLYEIDLPSFSLVRKIGNVHPKMFDVVGTHGGILYTVSHPAGEICGWNGEGKNVCRIPCALRLSGSSCIVGNAVYLSSRNLSGVRRVNLPPVG